MMDGSRGGPLITEQHDGFSVFLGNGKDPVVTLGIGVRPSAVVAHFDLTTHCLVDGNYDGTVYLCDLEEICQRLNKVGLGW